MGPAPLYNGPGNIKCVKAKRNIKKFGPECYEVELIYTLTVSSAKKVPRDVLQSDTYFNFSPLTLMGNLG